MAFDDKTQPFVGNTPPKNKYQEAARVWDSRIGSARVQAKNWRIAAFLFGGIALALVILNSFLVFNKQVETYVVPVDDLGRVGEIILLGDTYQPTKAETGYFLSEFVKKIRSKSIDPVVMRQNWLEAYGFLSMEAATVLNDYAQENQPLANIGKEARSVAIRSVVQRSDDTYQLAWIEKQFVKGKNIGTRHYTGVFTVTSEKPKTPEQIYKNPLGIKITSMTWDQELTNEK